MQRTAALLIPEIFSGFAEGRSAGRPKTVNLFFRQADAIVAQASGHKRGSKLTKPPFVATQRTASDSGTSSLSEVTCQTQSRGTASELSCCTVIPLCQRALQVVSGKAGAVPALSGRNP